MADAEMLRKGTQFAVVQRETLAVEVHTRLGGIGVGAGGSRRLVGAAGTTCTAATHRLAVAQLGEAHLECLVARLRQERALVELASSARATLADGILKARSEWQERKCNERALLRIGQSRPVGASLAQLVGSRELGRQKQLGDRAGNVRARHGGGDDGWWRVGGGRRAGRRSE